MQRACAAALLHQGKTIISNPGNSNDDLAALDVIKKLGAIVNRSGDQLEVSSKGVNAISPEVNCGESGLGLRMFAPIAALSSQQIILNGSGSLLQRPMDFFDEIFPLLQIDIQSNHGRLPVQIKGPLQPKNITIDGSLSSQFLTGLLMAYATACRSPVTIRVRDLKSKPYIDLTLQVMKHFGWDVDNENYDAFHFKPSVNPIQQTVSYTVEGDWSGAAFLLVAGAVAGNVTIQGLDINSPQADKAILTALTLSGANLLVEDHKLAISSVPLTAFAFDATDCPDLFPPLAVLAANANGVSAIKGVHRLTHKESDRTAALQQEFAKMGIEIRVKDDDMLITGSSAIKGAIVYSHHDHRIAMACTVMGLKATGETVIQDAEAINKSYPAFYGHLQKLNARISIS